MAGAISDINQGLIGISHTTGTQQSDMPSKKMVKPSAGSTITVHTESALSLEDSGNHLMKFIRGERLDSYAPQEQKELRQEMLSVIQQSEKEVSEADAKALNQLKILLESDEKLEIMAMMARNVLISA